MHTLVYSKDSYLSVYKYKYKYILYTYTYMLLYAYENFSCVDVGCVYLYERLTTSSLSWTLTGMLQASDRSIGDEFGGRDMDMLGDIIAIGSAFDDDMGDASG